MSAARNAIRALSPSPRPLLKTSPRPNLQRVVRGSPRTSPLEGSRLQVTHCSQPQFGRINRRLEIDKSPCKVESPISVHITPVNDKENHNTNDSKRGSHNTLSDLLQFSPSIFVNTSPSQSSPNLRKRQHNSPLYTPDRKDEFLGRGSFGNVRLCKHTSRPFALKVVQQSKNEKVGEVNLLGMRHANLVQIFQVIKKPNCTYVCMEFGGHCNLQKILDSDGELIFETRIRFAQQIASGLSYCHQNQILHLDVKPANVIVSPFGVCKLGDFGLSQKLPIENPLTTVIGTAAYAAPEILQGQRIATAADVYSLGIILWQVYTREVPFSGMHPHTIIYRVVSQDVRPSFDTFKPSETQLEEEFIALAKQCWASEPSKRLKCVGVLNALNSLLCP